MTAELHSFPRAGAGAPPPLVPSSVDVRDAPHFRFDIARMLDSDWYRSCSPIQALAGINLHARALHQTPSGSLPSADGLLARLADFGRDVEAWLAAKAKALEGWILCTDNRWYHPEVARNALHIWIARLEKRRISAFGNQSRCPDQDFGLASIAHDIDEALAALRAIDPQDAMLREATARAISWRGKLANPKPADVHQLAEANPAEPNRLPNRMPIRQPHGGIPKRS